MARPERAFYPPVIIGTPASARMRWLVIQLPRRGSIVIQLIWLLSAACVGPASALAGFVALTLFRQSVVALLAQVVSVGIVELLAELRTVGGAVWTPARRAGTTVTVAAVMYLAVDSAMLGISGAQPTPPPIACLVRICAAHVLTGAMCESGGFPVFLPWRTSWSAASTVRAVWTALACLGTVACPADCAPLAPIVDAAARIAFCAAWWQSTDRSPACRAIAATCHVGFLAWLCIEAFAPRSALPLVALAGGRMIHQLSFLAVALNVILARETVVPPAFR